MNLQVLVVGENVAEQMATYDGNREGPFNAPPPTDLLAFFSGARRWHHLKELAHFCRLGCFLIT